jgi:hypothetical protein
MHRQLGLSKIDSFHSVFVLACYGIGQRRMNNSVIDLPLIKQSTDVLYIPVLSECFLQATVPQLMIHLTKDQSGVRCRNRIVIAAPRSTLREMDSVPIN